MKPIAPSLRRLLALVFVAVGCLLAQGQPARGAAPAFAVRMQSLPKTTPSGVAMDYIAFDPATGSVWVPAGNTGTVVVIDAKTGAVRSIDGQPTAEMTRGERKLVVGPSSVTI